jgi:two-component system response regulator PilR (NtrC family)
LTPRAQSKKPGGRKKRTSAVAAVVEPSFLVVDDEPLVARSLTGVLCRFGSVWAAATLAEALEQLHARTDWSGFVIDLRLPDGSGLELLTHARARHPLAPAILLSGAMNPEGINGAFALGARCLCKPWPPEFLQSFAREALTTQEAIWRASTL